MVLDLAILAHRWSFGVAGAFVAAVASAAVAAFVAAVAGTVVADTAAAAGNN